MGEMRLGWGIRTAKIYFPREWSIGICLSHSYEETYLYINLLFFTVSIGKMMMEDIKGADI